MTGKAPTKCGVSGFSLDVNVRIAQGGGMLFCVSMKCKAKFSRVKVECCEMLGKIEMRFERLSELMRYMFGVATRQHGSEPMVFDFGVRQLPDALNFIVNRGKYANWESNPLVNLLTSEYAEETNAVEPIEPYMSMVDGLDMQYGARDDRIFTAANPHRAPPSVLENYEDGDERYYHIAKMLHAQAMDEKQAEEAGPRREDVSPAVERRVSGVGHVGAVVDALQSPKGVGRSVRLEATIGDDSSVDEDETVSVLMTGSDDAASVPELVDDAVWATVDDEAKTEEPVNIRCEPDGLVIGFDSFGVKMQSYYQHLAARLGDSTKANFSRVLHFGGSPGYTAGAMSLQPPEPGLKYTIVDVRPGSKRIWQSRDNVQVDTVVVDVEALQVDNFVEELLVRVGPQVVICDWSSQTGVDNDPINLMIAAKSKAAGAAVLLRWHGLPNQDVAKLAQHLIVDDPWTGGRAQYYESWSARNYNVVHDHDRGGLVAVFDVGEDAYSAKVLATYASGHVLAEHGDVDEYSYEAVTPSMWGDLFVLRSAVAYVPETTNLDRLFSWLELRSEAPENSPSPESWVKALPYTLLQNPGVRALVRSNYLSLLAMCSYNEEDPPPLDEYRAFLANPHSALLTADGAVIDRAIGDSWGVSRLPIQTSMAYLSGVLVDPIQVEGMRLRMHALFCAAGSRPHVSEMNAYCLKLAHCGSRSEALGTIGQSLVHVMAGAGAHRPRPGKPKIGVYIRRAVERHLYAMGRLITSAHPPGYAERMRRLGAVRIKGPTVQDRGHVIAPSRASAPARYAGQSAGTVSIVYRSRR